ncbi:TetR/AcrR family transcriptional regulator [Actinotalea caeni]|uniref:TetR/AcrR family transcriptional regulator n=1 Tax=Actinotalea caeni TaxID=1348467 RepID=UPI0012E2007B|nr:TetR family transcriptional regulator [Actinotalea caeni]
MAGLRERWRREAMQTIQERALDLFDERGFANVTIEQVAAAAEVSPSSVYRYFGTKEGLLVADEFDAMSPEQLRERFDPLDPVSSLVAAVRRYEAAAAEQGVETPWRRVRYFVSEPAVRAAVCANLERIAREVAPMLQTPDGLTPGQARVAASALAFGYLAALELWFEDGGEHPIAGYVEEGLSPLRAIWAGADD